MQLFRKIYTIRADIDRVFYCFSDFDYILKEMHRLKDDEDIEVFRQGDKLVFKGESTLFSISQTETNKPVLFRAQITPESKSMSWFGTATITCQFSDCGKTTQVLTEITISKNPNFFWKGLIKVIMFIIQWRSRSDEKKYIEAIEQNN
jgi:hypothetical protein